MVINTNRKKGVKMELYTQKQLKGLVNNGIAKDISYYHIKDREELEKMESYLIQVGYCKGIYGCNGKLFKGKNTNNLYAIIGNTQAIYIF